MEYATAAYKYTHLKPRYSEGLWCIGHIRQVSIQEYTYSYSFWDVEHRYTRFPRDLDEERAVEETDKIIARLLAV